MSINLNLDTSLPVWLIWVGEIYLHVHQLLPLLLHIVRNAAPVSFFLGNSLAFSNVAGTISGLLWIVMGCYGINKQRDDY